MCGVAGYSFVPGFEVDLQQVTRLLLAGLAERGEDACGYAWREPGHSAHVVKHPLPPLEFLESIAAEVPVRGREGIIHIRDFTKGRPAHHGNNHPIIHGAITGIHNGIIQNDDELFERHERDRALPGMTVDSEAVFMLLDEHDGNIQAAANELCGSYCALWFDSRRPQEGVNVMRGKARPLAIATGDGFVLVASTIHALEFTLKGLGLTARIRRVSSGVHFRMLDGRVVGRTRIQVTPFEEAKTFRYTRDVAHAVAARLHVLDQLRRRGRERSELVQSEDLPPAIGA